MLGTDTNYITIGEAAKLLPGNPHISSLHRWIKKGIGGEKLKAIRVGQKLYTTHEDLESFIAKLSETDADRLAADGC